MKVNIKKEGKTHSHNIINSWEDVTLDKWAQLVASTKKAKGKAAEAVASITALSDMPKDLISELSLFDVATLMSKLADIQSRASSDLKNEITVDGKTYGYHPNLSEITLGEYADIERCITDGVEDNLVEVMAILYRPIVERKGRFYTIEKYDTESKKLREQDFKNMPAETVESALVFFWTFVNELLKTLPLYLTERLKTVTS